MPVSQETRNVIEEMRRNGVDAAILAGLERELDAKPAAEKGVSNGVMAQSTFNSYRQKKDNEIQELKTKLTNLASLQASAGNLEGDIKAQVLAQIATKEKELTDEGYDIDEVKALVGKLISDPSTLGKLNASTEPVIQKEKEKEMPNDSPQDKRYVDSQTFANTLLETGTNLALGNINMSIEIAKALREADRLGVELPDEKLNGFQEAVFKGLDAGKKPQAIMDEFFGFPAIREAKLKETRDAELLAAEEKGRREALKEVGVNPRKSLQNSSRNNPVLDRQRLSGEKADSRIADIKDLPKNEKGDPEYFRLRRYDRNTRRMEHVQNASGRFDKVSEVYDDDGLVRSALE